MLGSPSPVSQLFKNMLSYDGNMMLAMAVFSLILVVAFVILLHVYAKWLLVQARHRNSAGSPINNYLGPRIPHPLPSLSHHRYNSSQGSDMMMMMMTKLGVDPSVIALIPLFVYESSSRNVRLECVICMGQFEEKEVGRELPKCGHSFHVECIDMWLMSHTNCPLCRSPVLGFIKSEEEEEEEECKDNPFVLLEEFSHGDCLEMNNSSSSNNHNEKDDEDDGGSVLEFVIKD